MLLRRFSTLSQHLNQIKPSWSLATVLPNSDSRVSEVEIDRLSNLACLEIKPEKLKVIADDLGKIIGFLELVKTYDTGNVEAQHTLVQENLRLRPDVVEATATQDQMLKNSQGTHGAFFAVPKVFDN